MFGCFESELDNLYWRYTYSELKKRISLHVGYTTASHLAQFSTLASVVSAAFGGKKEKPKITEDLTVLNSDQYLARIAQLGSI